MLLYSQQTALRPCLRCLQQQLPLSWPRLMAEWAPPCPAVPLLLPHWSACWNWAGWHYRAQPDHTVKGDYAVNRHAHKQHAAEVKNKQKKGPFLAWINSLPPPPPQKKNSQKNAMFLLLQLMNWHKCVSVLIRHQRKSRRQKEEREKQLKVKKIAGKRRKKNMQLGLCCPPQKAAPPVLLQSCLPSPCISLIKMGGCRSCNETRSLSPPQHSSLPLSWLTALAPLFHQQKVRHSLGAPVKTAVLLTLLNELHLFFFKSGHVLDNTEMSVCLHVVLHFHLPLLPFFWWN